MNNNIKKVFYKYKTFGLIFGTQFLFYKTFLKKREYILRRKSIRLLDKNFGHIFRENSNMSPQNIQFDKNIFVFWGQGFDVLPEIPRKSLETIEKNYPDYILHKIDLSNFSKYVTVDENILRLFEKGNI